MSQWVNLLLSALALTATVSLETIVEWFKRRRKAKPEPGVLVHARSRSSGGLVLAGALVVGAILIATFTHQSASKSPPITGPATVPTTSPAVIPIDADTRLLDVNHDGAPDFVASGTQLVAIPAPDNSFKLDSGLSGVIAAAIGALVGLAGIHVAAKKKDPEPDAKLAAVLAKLEQRLTLSDLKKEDFEGP